MRRKTLILVTLAIPMLAILIMLTMLVSFLSGPLALERRPGPVCVFEVPFRFSGDEESVTQEFFLVLPPDTYVLWVHFPDAPEDVDLPVSMARIEYSRVGERKGKCVMDAGMTMRLRIDTEDFGYNNGKLPFNAFQVRHSMTAIHIVFRLENPSEIPAGLRNWRLRIATDDEYGDSTPWVTFRREGPEPEQASPTGVAVPR